MNGPNDKRILHNLKILLIVLVIVLLIGAVIYSLLEKMTFLDALYSVVMVMTGIGANRDPGSVAGKWFNIALALASVAIAIGFIAHVGHVLLRREYLASLHGWRLSMKDHTILCGLSHTSHELLKRLPKEKFILIVREHAEATLLQHEGFNTIVGDFTSSKVLKQAGIDHANLLIASSESDADNAFACLTSKSLSKDLPVIVRMSRSENREKMQEVGADEIIAPAELAANAVIGAMVRLEKRS